MTKKDWIFAVICAIFVAIQVFFDLKIPDYMSVITDAIGEGKPSSTILDYGLEMVLCAIASAVVSLLASVMAARVAVSLCRTLRRLQFEKVGAFTPEDIDKFSVDSLITRSTNDVAQIQNFIGQAFQLVIRVPIITVWAIVKMSGAEWQWTAVTAAGVVIMLIAMFGVLWITRPRYRKIPVLTDSINHYSLEHLTGIRVVRAYNSEGFQEDKFERASLDMMDNAIGIWKIASIMPPISTAISNFMTLAIYWIGVLLIAGTNGSTQNMNLFSDMIVFSSYATLVLGTYMRLAFIVQFSTRAMASLKRVNEILEYEPCIPDGTYEGEGTEKGTVEFDHVTFTYPGSKREALLDVSFKVEKGQTVAVMGATGSGKSTLVDLILRFYTPDSGTIKVDGIPVNEYVRTSLNERISYVPQTTTVFTGTVEENVNYGSTAESRTIEDVRRAVDVAQAREFVDDLPGKESFIVSEEGHNLSGGQRQRITIARALCKNADICIFDDPFSALDFATDKKLRASLGEQFANSTKILVAQRVGTVMNADLIIVLDEGKIIGRGTHDELMKSCQIYHDLAVSQMAEGTY